MVLMVDAAYESDIAAKAFGAEMQAKVRPRRASTRRSGEIDNSSAPRGPHPTATVGLIKNYATKLDH
jgi:hypothetical protein